MEALKKIAEQIGERQRTKKLSSSFARAEFHRHCAAHYFQYVLPQLQLFKSHLQAQGQSISFEPLRILEDNSLGSVFILEHPTGKENALSIHYDALTQNISFTAITESNEPGTTFAVTPYEQAFAHEVYSAVEKFVRGIFEEAVL